jgi:hypothetical protein
LPRVTAILRLPVPQLARLVGAGLAGAMACSPGGSDDSGTGSLEVEWTGADTGKLSAPAVAEWCEGLRLVEVRAVHGDTGIALLIYPAGSRGRSDSAARGDSITPGNYRVISPSRADSRRPSAAVALRWFAETSIQGFRGDSGMVVLEATGPGMSAGRFFAYLGSTTENSGITAKGFFKGLSVTPAPPDCVGSPREESVEPEPLDELDPPAESAD